MLAPLLLQLVGCKTASSKTRIETLCLRLLIRAILVAKQLPAKQGLKQ